MRVSSTEPGVIVSGVVHIALLLATLVAFSDAPQFIDAQESVPVDVITDQQFNQITKGDKQAKDVKPTPVKADKPAEVEEKKPTPRVEAKVDIPTPPPPLKRIPDPGEDDDKPEPTPVPTPPKRIAALPPEPPKLEPPKPEPPKPPVRPVEPVKAEPKPEPPKPKDAEAIEPPKPPVKPKIEPKKVEVTPPEPPTKARPTPKEEPKPKAEEKPSLDKTALAKILDQKKAEEKPSLDKTALSKLLDQKKSEEKPASRPKSGEESSEPKTRLDPGAVSRLLSKEQPGQKPSTARAPSQTASIGSPTASAPKMSPSLWGQLDGLLQEQYKQCWNSISLGNTQRYIPQIKVEYNRDGTLIGQPALLNPPGDPNLKIIAEGAMRAVRRCNPLKIPAQFAPFFEQWKSRTLRMDPDELS